jgi:hypothetical protein
MMVVRRHRFNLYFVALLSVVVVTACKSPEKKLVSALRLHLEVNREKTGRSNPVPIYRGQPVLVNLQVEPFLTEGLVREAKVVDDLGGFSLHIAFERRGTWLLEQYTTANIGKRIGVYAEFNNPPGAKTNTLRWLAAPMITRPTTNGVFVFTPDASRDECAALVVGLNNLAKKLEDDLKW